MGVMQNLTAWAGLKLLRASAQGGRLVSDPLVQEFFGASLTGSGMFVTPDSAMRVSAVYACIKLLSNSVGTLPFSVFRRGADTTRQIDLNHPLYSVLHDRPNDWQTPFQFRQMMTAHLLLRGNAYAQIISGPGVAVKELIPLHPDRTRAFRAPDGKVAYEHTPISGPRRILLQDEVLHLADLTLDDGFTGISPIRLHAETVGSAMAARDYGARVFGNSGQPKGGIKVPTALDDEARKSLLEGWMARHGGVANAGRPAILDRGMDWVQMGMSNEDAQYIETMRYNKGDIASIYGVPPYLIGEHEKTSSWGTGLEQLNISFLTYSLMPWLVIWEQSCERDLFTSSSRKTCFIEFTVDGLLRGDFKTRMDGYAVGIQWGIYTINEVRAKENLPQVDGGNMRLQPLNMAPADRAMDVLLKTAPGPLTGRQLEAISTIRNRLNGSATPELLAALAALEATPAAHAA